MKNKILTALKLAGILVLLLGIYFALNPITPLYEGTITVNAPPSKIWPYLVTPEEWTKWDKNINKATSDSQDNTLSQGEHLTIDIKEGPKMSFEVKEITPEKHLELVAPLGWIKLSSVYDLDSKDGSTTTYHVKVQGEGFFSQFMYMMKSTFEKNTIGEMQLLKKLAES